MYRPRLDCDAPAAAFVAGLTVLNGRAESSMAVTRPMMRNIEKPQVATVQTRKQKKNL